MDADRFMQSHRALGACTREFGRLAEEITSRIEELRNETPDTAEADVRVTPERCIVQLGPVGLTLSWLRSTRDSVAEGRLLVIAWLGTVGRGSARSPERVTAPSGNASPVALWEQVFVAAGTSEASWQWLPEGGTTGGMGSSELATRCMEPLRAALARHTS
jgi:hypothetical protein